MSLLQIITNPVYMIPFSVQNIVKGKKKKMLQYSVMGTGLSDHQEMRTLFLRFHLRRLQLRKFQYTNNKNFDSKHFHHDFDPEL